MYPQSLWAKCEEIRRSHEISSDVQAKNFQTEYGAVSLKEIVCDIYQTNYQIDIYLRLNF